MCLEIPHILGNLSLYQLYKFLNLKAKFVYHWKWLAAARWYVGGSGIGGIKETQEMLDFCEEHNITCMIEKIPISYINTVMERLEKVDMKYHFVTDIENSLKSEN
jgi:D-arabinose 1-dehydrogenase-like Zn-dependent alcohol dehydrogenase